jgi:hypothetical protein
VTASYDKSDNSLWLRRSGVKTTMLLNSQMLDLKKPINVFFGYWKRPLSPVTVTESPVIQRMTLEARGDPAFIFSAAVSIDPAPIKIEEGNMRVEDGVFGLGHNLKAKL